MAEIPKPAFEKPLDPEKRVQNKPPVVKAPGA